MIILCVHKDNPYDFKQLAQLASSRPENAEHQLKEVPEEDVHKVDPQIDPRSSSAVLEEP